MRRWILALTIAALAALLWLARLDPRPRESTAARPSPATALPLDGTLPGRGVRLVVRIPGYRALERALDPHWLNAGLPAALVLEREE